MLIALLRHLMMGLWLTVHCNVVGVTVLCNGVGVHSAL